MLKQTHRCTVVASDAYVVSTAMKTAVSVQRRRGKHQFDAEVWKGQQRVRLCFNPGTTKANHSYASRSPSRCPLGKRLVMNAIPRLSAALLASAIAISSGTLAADRNVLQVLTPAAVSLPVEGELPSLGSATGWLNTQPLTTDSLC
jgi:hypothetical protein